MSETARPATEHRGLRDAAGAVRDRVRGWHRPPQWLWGVSLVAQVLSAAALTGYTFFFVDDFLFLEQARTRAFSLDYLRAPLFEHFSAISRLLDKLLVVLAPGSFLLAHCFELAMYLGALIAFAMVIRTILGNTWSAFTLTVVFGQSIFLMRLLNWWTATANILPASIFTLLALWCYLRWRETRSWKLLAGSFAAFALALLDYETAMLFPAYVAVVSLLVLERRLSLRAWLAALYRDRWAWTGYVVLEGAALVNYYSFYYGHPPARPSVGEVGNYLVIAFFETFIPALVGIKYPVAPGRHTAVIVAAAIVFGAAVAVTLYLRPRAWRCLAAFVIVFLVTMLPVALTRIREFGVGIGHVVYYQQSVQFMFLVLAAYAISARWSGRRAPSARGTPARSAWRSRMLALRRPSRRALAVAGTAAVAVYTVLYLTSLKSMEAASWQPLRDSAFVSEYLASVKQVRAATGREPVLVDLKVPHEVLPKHLWPYTTYHQFFGLFNPNLRVNEITDPLYVVNPLGRLLAVAFAVSTSGLIDRARVSATPGSPRSAAALPGRSSACVPAGRSALWLHVPLALPQQMTAQTNGLSYAIRVHFRMPARGSVAVRLFATLGGSGFATVTHLWDRGSHGQLIATDFTGSVVALGFKLPARGCVTGLEFGSLHFASQH